MNACVRFASVLMLCLPALAACGPSAPADPTALPADYETTMFQMGSLTGGDNLLNLGTDHKNKQDSSRGGLAVNAYLWRGALDTLSFMPLASADPFGGVIITDWWVPPTSSDERFKATAYVLGRELSSDAVRVVIYREVLQNGQWVNAPVSPETVGDIENKVLARARQLRVQSASNS
ncbi:MAG TPA: DUF3576 domain-containing protein [Acetobacteraceae bacterium]|jgi:hypothetical protein